MTEIKPYQIHVLDHKIDRLKQKLALTDFPDQDADLEQDSWGQGPPVGEIKRLAEAWRASFDWRQVEAKLNELPHFIAQVNVDALGSFDVHFVHKRSSKPNAIPLLFLHGWPGSFYEVSKILYPLVQGSAEGSPVFDVVAPSLIDFGFSSAGKVGASLPSFLGRENANQSCRKDFRSSTTPKHTTSSCRCSATINTVCQLLWTTRNMAYFSYSHSSWGCRFHYLAIHGKEVWSLAVQGSPHQYPGAQPAN